MKYIVLLCFLGLASSVTLPESYEKEPLSAYTELEQKLLDDFNKYVSLLEEHMIKYRRIGYEDLEGLFHTLNKMRDAGMNYVEELEKVLSKFTSPVKEFIMRVLKFLGFKTEKKAPLRAYTELEQKILDDYNKYISLLEEDLIKYRRINFERLEGLFQTLNKMRDAGLNYVEQLENLLSKVTSPIKEIFENLLKAVGFKTEKNAPLRAYTELEQKILDDYNKYISLLEEDLIKYRRINFERLEGLFQTLNKMRDAGLNYVEKLENLLAKVTSPIKGFIEHLLEAVGFKISKSHVKDLPMKSYTELEEKILDDFNKYVSLLEEHYIKYREISYEGLQGFFKNLNKMRNAGMEYVDILENALSKFSGTVKEYIQYILKAIGFGKH